MGVLKGMLGASADGMFKIKPISSCNGFILISFVSELVYIATLYFCPYHPGLLQKILLCV